MKIIWNCLKNLLINLKYYFVPLGISAFFIIIAISVGLPVVTDNIKATFVGIASELGHVDFNWSKAWEGIVIELAKLDSSGGMNGFLDQVSSSEWIVNTLKKVAFDLFGDSVNTQHIVDMITNCAQSIIGTISLIFAMAIVGFVVSFFVLMVSVRKTITKTGWWKAILYSILDTALFFVFVLIYLKIKPSQVWLKILINIIYVLGIVLFSFVESYFFHGFKKIRFKEAINIRSILFWFIGSIITLAVGVGLTALLAVLIPWYGGIILAIPLIEIVLLVIHLNAEGYIKHLAINKKKESKLEKKVA